MIYIFRSGNFCSDRWLCQLNSSVMMKTTTTLLSFFSTASVSRLKSILFGRPRVSESSYIAMLRCMRRDPRINPVNLWYFTAQYRKLWVTHHFYIRLIWTKAKSIEVVDGKNAYYDRCMSGSQTELSYRNNPIIVFFFSANKTKDNAQIALVPSNT